MTSSFRIGIAWTGAFLLMGCGAGLKEDLIAEGLDDPDDRRELFEATLRVLDDHPTYVDQLFRQAKSHPRTLDRFIANAARDLHEDELAKLTARHLAANPKSLERILVATMRAARDQPAARQAVADAIQAEAAIAAGIITDDPPLVQETLIETVRNVMHKPAARTAFVKGIDAVSPVMAGILADNPKLLTKLTEEIAGELAENPEVIAQMVAALGQDEERDEGGEQRRAEERRR
jgi:hemoglobin-like flavoprotein